MVIFNVHGQVMGTFACHAPLNTLIVHTPENNQHLKVLIWGGGRGGLRISTLCTNRKMLTIVNGPLQSDEFNAYQEVSNTNHFGSVSDTLGRLTATSQYMTS